MRFSLTGLLLATAVAFVSVHQPSRLLRDASLVQFERALLSPLIVDVPGPPLVRPTMMS